VITVTENAKRELKEILVAAGAGPDEGLRLFPTETEKYILGLDAEMSADQVVNYDGYKVLLVGIEYYRLLDGKILDCLNTENGITLFVQ
jgi:Fe-S cluster assembly iron-binding protein IscA